MKLVFIGFLSLFMSASAIAQKTFTFDYIEQRLDESEIVEDDVRKHFLGDAIARKMILLNDSYVFFEGTSPSNPLPTRQVDKYALYSSVKKLNAYYKKAVKKSTFTKDDAFLRFKKVLDIALCVRYQNTIDLEATLLKIKDVVVLEDMFATKIILDGLYSDAITKVE